MATDLVASRLMIRDAAIKV